MKKVLIISLVLLVIVQVTFFVLEEKVDKKNIYRKTAEKITEEKIDDEKEVIIDNESTNKRKLYLGAFADFGPNENIFTEESIREFEDMIDHRITWAYISNNWFEGIEFPTEKVNILKNMEITPYIRLMPRPNLNKAYQKTEFTLENIVNGDFDDKLYSWAKKAKESNIPIMIEFGTEVNISWFNWNGKWNGRGKRGGYGDPEKYDGPEVFIDAYQHIIDIFNDVKANNILWVYHINAISEPNRKWNTFLSYYPGDEYIDFIGISVYGAQTNKEKWTTFEESLEPSYNAVVANIDKPIIISEFGVVEDQRKREWIQEVFDTVLDERYGKIEGISYWHSKWINNDGSFSNLMINSSQGSLDAFRTGLLKGDFSKKVSLNTSN